MERLQLTTLAAQDISSALLVATYTADADRELLIQVYLSGLAGNGSYRACLTKQLLGAGSAYQSATSATALSPGVTTAFVPTTPLPVQDTDVVKVYAQGLAGDTSVAVVVEVFDTMSTLSTLTAAQVNAEADTALSDYDPPTHTEMTNALAALNDLSAAQVNAEVDTALADYDGPTHTELTSALSGLNDPTAAAIADAVWDENLNDHQDASSSGEYLEGIGRFAGTGTNTIKGFLQAICREDLTVPSEIGGDYDPADDSLMATTVSAGAVADAVWEDGLTEHTGTSTFGGEMQALAKLTELQSELTALQTALTTLIENLNDVSASQLSSAVTGAMNDYNLATAAQVQLVPSLSAEGVWTYSRRTLTHGRVARTSTDDDNAITKYAGDTWADTISSVDGLSTADDVLLCIKTRETDADSASIALISSAAGLVYWNAAAASDSTLASLTPDAEEETVDFSISETLTGAISAGSYYWGIKTIDTDGEKITQASGTLIVSSARVDAITVQT